MLTETLSETRGRIGAMPETTQDLWALIEPWLAAERLELDDLELVGAGRGRVLRLLVDGDGGVDIDRLAAVSEGISRLLDADGDFEGSYQLEVSSPGLERKLKRPRHFEKSVGREVTVKGRAPEGTVVVKGTLAAATPGGVTIDTEDGSRSFAYEDVMSARTVFRWEKAPKPGKRR